MPGLDGEDDATLEALREFASEHGLPIVIKAVAGGGGKGMRVVREEGELESALDSARREAQSAFGDDRVLAERYLERPRHVEVQVLADAHGTAIHLGERECSLQRRHQKVVEEAPSPVVDDALRERMGEAAVALATACGYVNAGTVEFIVPHDGGDFFFLEMNTRLQVEHPVTELVYGVDLVEQQLRVAAGEPLRLRGQAPQSPRRRGAHLRRGPGRRVPARDRDGPRLPRAAPARGSTPASAPGTEVGTRFDPLLAKVIAHGDDRPTALARLDRALAELTILGVTTNAAFTRELLQRDDVRAGEQDTGLIERVLADTPPRTPDDLLPAAIAAAFARDTRELTTPPGPWLRRFDDVGEARATPDSVTIGERTWRTNATEVTVPSVARIEVDGVSRAYAVHADDEGLWIARDGHHLALVPEARSRGAHGAAAGSLEAPMPGTVLLVHAANGDEVAEGDVLLVLESMKMELSIAAPHAGTVDGLDAQARRQRQAPPAARRRHRRRGGGRRVSFRDEHLALLEDLDGRLERVRAGGGPRATERHVARGKLPVRDRVERLCDPGAPFLELSALAAEELYDGDAPGAGMVTGVGLVHGRRCVIVANDATVKGGTYYPMTVKKHLRAQEVALDNHLPCIYLVDSGGAFLPKQDDVFPDREHFGRIFFNQARMSERSIPQISAVMGSCTAGGAYVPAMSDETVIVREQGTIFLGGPPLVKAATGEEVSAEDLGGGDVHARRSGVVDHLAEDDDHALEIVRGIVATLPAPHAAPWAVAEPKPPREDRDGLLDLIPLDARTPYDARDLIRHLVDDSAIQEFKELYGTTIVCAFARLDGHPVGVIANNGILFSESSLKAAHFIELCDRRGIPLIFLQNISGFMVGRDYEAGGIAKDGAKLVTAVSCRAGAEVHGDRRRLVRRRQLRHVRPRLRPALLVHVAQRAHQRDGRRAGRRGDGRGRPARARRRTARAVRAPGPGDLLDRADLGRRRDRPARHARRARPGAGRDHAGPAPGRRLRRLPDVIERPRDPARLVAGGPARRRALRRRGLPALAVLRRAVASGVGFTAGRGDSDERDRVRRLGAVRDGLDPRRRRRGGRSRGRRRAGQRPLPGDGDRARAVAARRPAQARAAGPADRRRVVGDGLARRRDLRPLVPVRRDGDPVRHLAGRDDRRGLRRRRARRPGPLRARRDLPDVLPRAAVRRAHDPAGERRSPPAGRDRARAHPLHAGRRARPRRLAGRVRGRLRPRGPAGDA